MCSVARASPAQPAGPAMCVASAANIAYAGAAVTAAYASYVGFATLAMAPVVPLALASQDDRRPEEQPGLVDSLFPGFNTSALLWRVSLLQMLEYTSSLLIGSAFGAPKLCSLYLLGASWGPAISAGALWRLLLPITLHANAMHIFFNLFFQLRIGFGMEKQFGRRKFCILYIFSGFVGNLLSVVADPFKLSVGASTSGFGLLGVWAAEVLLTWDLLGESRSRVFWWFAFMVLSCVMMSTISPNVDFVGHLGGALGGFLMAIWLADMREEHQPAWYFQAKTMARNSAALLIVASLFKAVTLGPEGPVPFCGTILHPRQLPF